MQELELVHKRAMSIICPNRNYQDILRGDFLDNRETGAQKYRDALRKNHEFCCFFGTWR